MKKLILAGVLSLVATGAFALDKNLGDSSEYGQSTLVDHGPGAKTTMLGPHHDHGDNVAQDFIEHDHDVPVMSHPEGPTTGNNGTKLHDHGDDVYKDFTPHPHS